jgi:hypothetical protein
MTNANPRHFLARIEARFRRANPGSVLIIVIVLLLLLAILGAAYISTTRSARVASAQSVLNSDVDTMLSGISKICEGIIVDDLNDTFGNLHGNTAYSGNTITNRSFYQGQAEGAITLGNPNFAPNVAAYNPGDVANTTDYGGSIFYYLPQGGVSSTPISDTGASTGWQVMNGHLPATACGADPWLADRIPDPAGTGSPLWTSITQTIQFVPAVGATPASLAPKSILGTAFVDPTTNTDLYLSGKLMSPLVGVPGSANPLIPTVMPTALPNGLNMPAFKYGTGGNPFPAADADGDGIADSLFFQVPGVSLDGLTWYAAVRIIDNNSAINANTAWSRDTLTFSSGGTDIWNLFQTSVGLQEIASASDSIGNVNKYRFNATTAGLTPFDESSLNSNQPPAASARTDYSFISQSEAYYQQLIRRIANPGYNTAGVRYQPFPLADEATLAYHFCLQNPNSMAQSVLESSTILQNSLCGTALKPAPVTPYDPSNATGWYNDNFAFPSPTYPTQPADDHFNTSPSTVLSMRALLVTRNPVSNYIQQVYNNNTVANGGEGPTSYDPILPNYMLPYSSAQVAAPHYKGIWSGGTSAPTYNLNDLVLRAPPSGYAYPPLTPTFISLANNNSGNDPATTINTSWAIQPWNVNPVKANVNTATFRELFRAFWSVMAGNPSNVTPFGVTAADSMSNGIYDSTANNLQFMFRSPLRDPTNSATSGTAAATALDTPPAAGTGITATYQNTMLLRAALAAVNTLGLRDNTQNIISHTFILNNAWVLGGPTGSGAAASQTPVEVRVYSSAPQPFISEVYVNTDIGTDPNPGGGTGTNPGGYVAIELYNPYPVAISMMNWKLAFIYRPSGPPTPPPNLAYPELQLQQIATLGTPYIPANPTKGTPAVPANPVIIPAYSYLLLENCNYSGATPIPGNGTTTDSNAATYRPFDSGILPRDGSTAWIGPPTKETKVSYGDLYVPFLENVIAKTVMPTGALSATSPGGEFVLLRPRRSDGALTKYTDPSSPSASAAGYESFDETTTSLADFVPLDSYDFSNLALQQAGDAVYYAWSYIRGKGTGYYFKTTYPGQYIVALNTPRAPRETGTGIPTNDAPLFGGVPNALPATWIASGGASPGPFTQPVFGQPSAASYADDFPPVQIYNVDVGNSLGTNDWMHFPNAVASPQNPTGMPAGTIYQHPLGGFARNGDMLDIPFIGSYRIRALNNPVTVGGVTTYSLTYTNPVGVFLELNSVTMDCSFAAITDTGGLSPDPMAQAQNIGRFVPMAATYPYLKQIAAVQAGTQTPPIGQDYYAWTRNLFNYLTVQSSSDAYLPNFDPNVSAEYGWSPTNAGNYAYPPYNNSTPTPPTPTLTADATATDETAQDKVGIEGLININTASWKVLSMLPFVPSTVPNYGQIDRQIAQNIVNYRLKYGPFTSIFDLNQVPGFQSGTSVSWIPPAAPPAPTAPTAPTSATGLLSPADPNFGTATAASTTPTGITEDYQWDCLTLSRISNLITTRSDTFTVYIEVQGWQNVGTANAQPMITRRYAFIVDRSAINADPNSRFLKTVTVPND